MQFDWREDLQEKIKLSNFLAEITDKAAKYPIPSGLVGSIVTIVGS